MTDKEYEAWRAKQEKADTHDSEDKAPADTPTVAPEPRPGAETVEPTEAPEDPPLELRSPLANVFGGAGGIELDAPDAVHADDADDGPIIDVDAPDEEAIAAHDDAVAKRSDAVWYAVVGIAMLFMSGFHWGIAVGGVIMVVYGTLRYIHYSRLAKAAYDPWDDSDIDAWEDNEMG